MFRRLGMVLAHGTASSPRGRGPLAISVVAAACLGACNSTPIPVAPLAGKDTERDPDDDTRTNDGPGPQPRERATTGGSSGGTSGGGPQCDDADDPDPSGETKLDVGAPDGSLDFAVDCEGVRATKTNLGCEFWAVDLPNDYRGTEMSPPAEDQQFAIVVANTSPHNAATVEIFLGTTTTAVASHTVEPNATYTFRLAPNNVPADRPSTTTQAFRIVSNVPITAYQFNPLDNQVKVYSNDASLLFPSHALGTQYTAVTSNAIWLSKSDADPGVPAGAFIAVVAIDDGTTIDVFPTAELTGKPPTRKIAVPRGRVWNVLSESGAGQAGNLSGTRISANKPVAVFSGNVAAIEPTSRPSCCADHLEHQLLPLSSLGSSYVVVPPPRPTGSGNDLAYYRLTGAFEKVALAFCPTAPEAAPVALSPGETVGFETDQPFILRATGKSHPFSVTQFLESHSALNPSGQPGDPAMIVWPPADQFQHKYVFAVPRGYAANFVTIVSRGLGTIRLDGAAVPQEQLKLIGPLAGAQYYYVHKNVVDGSHVVEADVPVGIRVVGFDDSVSYGFPGGVGLREIAIPPVAG